MVELRSSLKRRGSLRPFTAYSLNPSAYTTPFHRSLPADPQRVMPIGSKVFVTAGLDWLLALDEDLLGKIVQVQVEFGPGPLVMRDGALWVANGGPEYERVLAQESFGFLSAPPAGFAASPVLRERPVAFAVPPEQVER